MKTGLILEGGAMRGLFSAGVTDVMMENNIKFDGAIGVSAGAAFGCNYKSNQPGRAFRYNIDYCRDPRYCSFRSLIKTGDLFGADFCYHKIPEELDPFDSETFNANPMEFYMVCTDILTGKPVYKKCGAVDNELLEWFRASASMPFVSKIVEVGGCKLLDGGISDSIPIRYFEELGYDRNVLILTRPMGYVKGRNRMLPAIKLAYRKYPDLIRAIERRHEVYNETLQYICEKEKSGEILVIRPKEPLPIGHVEHNADNLRRVYEIGREVGEQQLGAIRKFLEK